mgnify:FL=1
MESFTEFFSKAYPEKTLSVTSVYSLFNKEYSLCSLDLGVVNYDYNSCELCHSGSTPIEINPSSYYIRNAKDSGVTLSRTIADAGKSFFVKYQKHLDSLIYFHKGDPAKGNKHFPYYIDYNFLSRTQEFSSQLNLRLTESNANSPIIICLTPDDMLREAAGSHGIPLLVIDDIESLLEPSNLQAIQRSGNILIYDSVVINGDKLIAISNAVREIPALSSAVKCIEFLVGLLRPESEENFKNLKSTIAYSSDNGPPRTLNFIDFIILPDGGRKGCPWCVEREILVRSIKPNFRGEGIFHNRLRALSDLSIGVQGADSIFHIDDSTKNLLLGSDSYLAPKSTSISGAVLAAATGLQKMRTSAIEKNRLSPGFPHAQVLGSKNFRLYSEGLIRAALIRNCAAIELGVLEKESTMKILLRDIEKESQKVLLSEYVVAALCGKFAPISNPSKKLVEQLEQLCGPDERLLSYILEK